MKTQRMVSVKWKKCLPKIKIKEIAQRKILTQLKTEIKFRMFKLEHIISLWETDDRLK